MTRQQVLYDTRRNWVLTSARKTLLEHGVEETTMEAIACGADYTRRTLYSYFSSRDEILLLLHMENNVPRREIQLKAMSDDSSGLENLLAWGKAYATWAEENSEEFRLQLFWDYRGVDPATLKEETFEAFEVQNNLLADDLKQIIGRGMSDGSIRTDADPEMAISQFLYSLRAVMSRALFPTYSFATFKCTPYVEHFLTTFKEGLKSN